MFSKYLLPKLSVPIKAPALVSPVTSQSLLGSQKHSYIAPMFCTKGSGVSRGLFDRGRSEVRVDIHEVGGHIPEMLLA